MSPARIRPFDERTTRRTDLLVARLAEQLRAERRRRGWSLTTLSTRAGVSRAAAGELELGGRASIDRWVAVAAALGLELEMDLVDPRRRAPTVRAEDPVHAAMGEWEASRLAAYGFGMGIDEPYPHFQFAGRADLAAWRLEPPALLHLENRTRFPNIGEVAGAWNAKRRWLGPELAKRLGIPGFLSETHVIVALWSAEVLHELRRRPAIFHALAPDPADGWPAWQRGTPPIRGRTSELILLDPSATGRQRAWIDLAAALAGARPRFRGDADAAERLGR